MRPWYGTNNYISGKMELLSVKLVYSWGLTGFTILGASGISKDFFFIVLITFSLSEIDLQK